MATPSKARKTIPLNSVTSVVAGQKTIIRTVDAYAYHGILLTLGGTTFGANYIDLIRVFYGNTEAMSITGADLDSLNQYMNAQASAVDKKLYIPFAGLGLLNQVDEESTAVHVGVPHSDKTVIQSIRVEISVAATAVDPTLTAEAIVRPAVAGRDPYFPFLRNTNVDVQGAGKKSFNDIVSRTDPQQQFLIGAYFKTAHLTALKIQKDQTDEFIRDVATNKRMQIDGERKPQAGWYMYDPRENGYGGISDALMTSDANSLKWELTVDAAESMVAYVSTVGTLG